MQESRKLKDSDLPPEVLEGLEPISDNVSESLVAGICQRLHKDRLVLSPQDQATLKDKILEKISYNVTITADFNMEKLEDIGIAPVAPNQARFDVFLEDPTEEEITTPEPVAPIMEEPVSWHREN